MKSILDKLTAELCPKHGSPYCFINKGEARTNESRMMCEKCIKPQNDGGIIRIRKAFKFLDEIEIQETQRRLQITSLWQQLKHNSEKIKETLTNLEEQMELLLSSSITQSQITRMLNDEFLNGQTTQLGIESLGEYLNSLIDQNGQQRMQQYVEQMEQQFLISNEIFVGQNKANAELSCLLDIIQQSIEQNQHKNSKDGNINTIDITKYIYETTQTISVNDYCVCISLNSNETQLIAAVGKLINIYQLSVQGEQFEQQYSLEGHAEQILKVKFNHNSTLIASCGLDNLIIIWSKQLNGKWSILDKLKGPHDNVSSICFNNNSTLLASGSNKGTIHIHNINNGKLQPQQISTEHNKYINDVCFNNDSTKLASGSDDQTIIIWQLNNQGKWIAFFTLKEQTSYVWSVQFNSESNQLISSSSENTIKIWQVDNVDKWRLVHTLTGHSYTVTSAYFNKQSNMIVSGSYDNSIKIWKTNKEGIWQCTQTIDQHVDSIRNAIINSDSSMIISCSEDKIIKVHKLK